jgi:hypothetical protein
MKIIVYNASHSYNHLAHSAQQSHLPPLDVPSPPNGRSCATTSLTRLPSIKSRPLPSSSKPQAMSPPIPSAVSTPDSPSTHRRAHLLLTPFLPILRSIKADMWANPNTWDNMKFDFGAKLTCGPKLIYDVALFMPREQET